jgi:hypothetical protein
MVKKAGQAGTVGPARVPETTASGIELGPATATGTESVQ